MTGLMDAASKMRPLVCVNVCVNMKSKRLVLFPKGCTDETGGPKWGSGRMRGARSELPTFKLYTRL